MLNEKTLPTKEVIDTYEANIIQWVKEGLTYKEIGRRLFISPQRAYKLINTMRYKMLLDMPTPIEARRALRASGEESIRLHPYTGTAAENEALFYIKRMLRTKLVEACRENPPLPFTLTIPDLWPLPPICPVLKIPLTPVAGKLSCPALFLLTPAQGYIKDNVVVVSSMALHMLRFDREVLEKAIAFIEAIQSRIELRAEVRELELDRKLADDEWTPP